jgi:hypothetical protein
LTKEEIIEKKEKRPCFEKIKELVVILKYRKPKYRIQADSLEIKT